MSERATAPERQAAFHMADVRHKRITPVPRLNDHGRLLGPASRASATRASRIRSPCFIDTFRLINIAHVRVGEFLREMTGDPVTRPDVA